MKEENNGQKKGMVCVWCLRVGRGGLFEKVTFKEASTID